MLNFATWNVRTLYGAGRLHQVQKEAERLQLDVVGLAEVRWMNSGMTKTENWNFYYVGDDDLHQRGVGFLVSPKVKKSVLKVEPVNDRLIMLRLNAKPRPITVIPMYMPTTNGDEAEVLEVYAEMQRIIDECHRKGRVVVMGDFNAQIGEGTLHSACGSFGYGRTNDRGEPLLDWMEDNKFIIIIIIYERICQKHSISKNIVTHIVSIANKNPIEG